MSTKPAPLARQDDLFRPIDDARGWTPPVGYPRLQGAELGLDLETRDDHLQTHGPGYATGRGYVVGVALAWRAADGTAAKGYWPVRHATGNNFPESHVRSWIQEIVGDPSTTIIVHNALYDLGWLRRWGVTVRCKVIDTGILGPLCDENRRSYSLDNLSHAALGVRKDETLLRQAAASYGVDPKRHMWMLPPHVVGIYAEQDAVLAYNLREHYKTQIEREDLHRVVRLEHDLIPVLLDMHYRGVRVDVDGAERLAAQLAREEAETVKALQTLCGFPVNVNQPDSLSRAFKARGIPVVQTDAGNDSFTKGWLDEIDDDLPRLVLKARRAHKARTTFVEGYVLKLHHNGRVHAQFPQLRSDEGGAVTGRFSSVKPNLQNLPAKHHASGALIRGMFLPEEGQLWAANDYSQQEPRLMVHFAAVVGLRGAETFADRYRNDPSTDFHTVVVDAAGIPRDKAKTIGLGKSYGMGGAKMARSLGLPTKWITGYDGTPFEVAGDEAQAVIDKFDTAVPFVGELAQLCSRRAKRRGTIRTILGRLRRFAPMHPHGAFAFTAMNGLVQGSAADQTKQAMVYAHGEKHTLLVPVHDELGASVAHKGEAEQVAEIMRAAVPLCIPTKVDIALGFHWGQAL